MNPTTEWRVKDRHGWIKVQKIRPMSNGAKDVYIYPPPNAPPIPDKIKTQSGFDYLRSTKELILYLIRYPEIPIDPYRINFEQFDDLEDGNAIGKTKPLRSTNAKSFVRFFKNGRFKWLNSVEKRNLKKILDEKDGLKKAAIRELPKNSKEENQKKLKQAVEILKKNDRSILKSLSNKSTKVQKIKKTKNPEHSLSNANTSTMSKFKIPTLANCGHCETKIRNVDLRKQMDGCFLCAECDQEDILRKFHMGTVSHKIASEKHKTPKDNFIPSNWISLHVNRYWNAKSSTVRDQIAKMMQLAFEGIVPYQDINDECKSIPNFEKSLGLEWTIQSNESSKNPTKSIKHWDSNTKFEEPSVANNLAKPLSKSTKKLKRSKSCSPSKNLKPSKKCKIIKPPKPSTSTLNSVQLGKIMSNIAKTHAIIK